MRQTYESVTIDRDLESLAAAVASHVGAAGFLAQRTLRSLQ